MKKNATILDLTPYFLMATLFLLPISSSGKSVGVIFSLVMIVCNSHYWPALRCAIRQNWAYFGMAMVSFALVACIWTSASSRDTFFVVEKYSKILYLPILAAGFSVRFARINGIRAFIAAMTLIGLLSIIKSYGFLEFWDVDAKSLFRNYIMTGFMAAYASYLAIWQLLEAPKKWQKLFYFFAILVLTYYILAVNIGRTGYVLYSFLLVLLAIQLLNIRQLLSALLAIFALFGLSYLCIDVMQARINTVYKELNSYAQVHGDKNTSIGYRLQFHEFAKNIFKRHPIVGSGTAGFTTFYRNEKPVPTWSRRLWEPHSQYWLILSEFGILGFALFALFFGSLLIACLNLAEMKVVAFGILFPFLLGCFSDSLLFYSGSGYFFLLFMALSMGETLDIKRGRSL